MTGEVSGRLTTQRLGAVGALTVAGLPVAAWYLAAAVEDAGGAGRNAARALLATGLWVAVLGPVVAVAVVAARRPAPGQAGRPVRWLGVALGALTLSTLAGHAPPVGGSGATGWNWDGKLLAAAAVALFAITWRGLSWRELGLGLRLRSGSWPLIAMSFLLATAVAVLLAATGTVSWEYAAFQLVVPGLDEELLYRGVLWAVLVAAFGRRWPVVGAATGWPMVLLVTLFTLIHVVGVDRDLEPVLGLRSTGRMVSLVAAGFLFGWVRERTGSIWPAVPVHNASNAALAPLSVVVLPSAAWTTNVAVLGAVLAAVHLSDRRQRDVRAAAGSFR